MAKVFADFVLKKLIKYSFESIYHGRLTEKFYLFRLIDHGQ